MEDVAVSGPLPLGAFLKLAGVAGTGGHAKVIIQSGDVTCERRGRDAPRADAPGRRRRWRGRPGVPRVVVSGLRLVNFRSYCDATVALRAGPQRRCRRERDRQDQPPRGRVVRAARELSAHAPRREAHHVGRALRARGTDSSRRPEAGAQQVDVGFAPEPGQAGALGRTRGRHRSTSCAGAARCSSSYPRACCWSRGARRGGAPTWTPSPPALDPQYAAAAREPAGRAASAQRATRRREERRRPGRARPMGRAVRPGRGGARASPPRPRRRAGGGLRARPRRRWRRPANGSSSGWSPSSTGVGYDEARSSRNCARAVRAR